MYVCNINVKENTAHTEKKRVKLLGVEPWFSYQAALCEQTCWSLMVVKVDYYH